MLTINACTSLCGEGGIKIRKLFFATRCWLSKDEEDGGKRWMLQEEDDKDLEGEFLFCFEGGCSY